MKTLILVSNFNKNKEVFSAQIQNFLSSKKDSVTIKTFEDIVIEVGQNNFKAFIGGENVSKYDLVYFRRVGPGFFALAANLAQIFSKLGVRYIDETWGGVGPRGNKLTSLIRLAAADVLIPNTIYASNKEKLPTYQQITKKIGTPFIAKDLTQQRGKGIFLIKNNKDLKNLKNLNHKIKLNHYIFQEFINKDSEYRLLILGKNVRVWEEKIAQKGEFRNNVSLGAKEIFLPLNDLPSDYQKIATTSAQVLKLQIAGVDLIKEAKTGKLYVLEVNRGPGFTYDDARSTEIEELTKYLTNEE